MKAFQFPLEKVLAFRKKQWEAESAILASLLEKKQQFARQLEQAAKSLEQAAENLRSMAQVDGQSVRQFAFTAESGRRALRRLQLALEGAEAQAARQRQVCVVARRDYELVHKLREARWAAWRKEADREQETLSTEAFLARRTQRRLAVSSRMASQPRAALTEPEPSVAVRADGLPAGETRR